MFKMLAVLLVLALHSGCAYAADQKISAMTDGGYIQDTDKIPVVRSGNNYRVHAGTMASQDADNVTLTGGLIDGILIGTNDPRDGYFDRLYALTSIDVGSGYMGASRYETNGTSEINDYDITTTALYVNNKGTFTANGTTAVVVSNSAVNTNSIIVPWLKTVGGTPGCQPYASAANVAGASFTVKACSGDTSVYNYIIIN